MGAIIIKPRNTEVITEVKKPEIIYVPDSAFYDALQDCIKSKETENKDIETKIIKRKQDVAKKAATVIDYTDDELKREVARRYELAKKAGRIPAGS